MNNPEALPAPAAGGKERESVWWIALKRILRSRMTRRIVAAVLLIVAEELSGAETFNRRSYGNSGSSAYDAGVPRDWQ